MQLTRRTLLTAVGLGSLGVGTATLGQPRRRFSDYTYAQTSDLPESVVRVAWYERYNGVFQERQNGTTDPGSNETLDPETAPAYVDDVATTADGPVLSLTGLLPGDDGVVVVGLETEPTDDLLADEIDVYLKTTVTDDEEVELLDPERAAGDTTADDGELDDELLVTVWRDGSPLGTCDGDVDFAETVTVPEQPASVALGADGAGADAGVKVVTGLTPGAPRCVSIAWTFPFESATNRSQGDTLGFDAVFAAVPAGATSPFATTGGETSAAR
ncbi:hypothetical protein RYH80_16010 [Halobaculum sp. MBLA0147]|uniref:hypothetical protein n=1 Tax=Halobaculum sp. MBLA0147 TaxID=3079934 RepID=UPI003524E820